MFVLKNYCKSYLLACQQKYITYTNIIIIFYYIWNYIWERFIMYSQNYLLSFKQRMYKLLCSRVTYYFKSVHAVKWIIWSLKAEIDKLSFPTVSKWSSWRRCSCKVNTIATWLLSKAKVAIRIPTGFRNSDLSAMIKVK